MSASIQKSLDVSVKPRGYPIHIGRGLKVDVTNLVNELKSAKRPLALITDSNVTELQHDFISDAFCDIPTFVLPAGEKEKNLSNFTDAHEFLANEGLNRSAVVFAFGGGVVGDFAGFVAATFMRGIDFVQIPTTLLSMVDSSVGGKTGVNLRAGKNLVGSFHQPLSVWIDIERLKTLSAREFSAGMAEIIKAGLLADSGLFEKLESVGRLEPEHPELIDVIHRSCEIKARVVEADEKETQKSGGRALLNLGHTFGHGIEQSTVYERYLHGEAISIGMMMAAHLSRLLGNIDDSAVTRMQVIFEKYDLPTVLDPAVSCDHLLSAMNRDKKHLLGNTKFVVLESIGSAKTILNVESSLVVEALLNGGAIEG